MLENQIENLVTQTDVEVPEEETATDKSQREIMIIDDDIDFRLSLAELLSLQGYKIITAKNGREAIDALLKSESTPGLILLDLNMPVENGVAFWNELNEHKDLCHIPTIVITGFSANTEQLIGIEAVMEKPVDKLELLEKVEKIFQE
jgi:response regulator RpfG family c-di-GMP phosphodiesterase